MPSDFDKLRFICEPGRAGRRRYSTPARPIFKLLPDDVSSCQPARSAADVAIFIRAILCLLIGHLSTLLYHAVWMNDCSDTCRPMAYQPKFD